MFRALSCGSVLWRVTHITAEEQAVEKEFCIEEYSALQSIIRQCALASYTSFGRRKVCEILRKCYVQRPLLQQCALAGYAYYSRRTGC